MLHVNDSLAALPPPFLVIDHDGKILQYWNITPSGSWADDCSAGRQYAKLALTYAKRLKRPTLIVRILKVIHEKPRFSGLEVGFIHYTVESAMKNQ